LFLQIHQRKQIFESNQLLLLTAPTATALIGQATSYGPFTWQNLIEGNVFKDIAGLAPAKQ
jgi:hypothetical protein